MTLIEKLKTAAEIVMSVKPKVFKGTIVLTVKETPIICYGISESSCAMQIKEQVQTNTSYYLVVKKQTEDGEKITIHKVYDKLKID